MYEMKVKWNFSGIITKIKDNCISMFLTFDFILLYYYYYFVDKNIVLICPAQAWGWLIREYIRYQREAIGLFSYSGQICNWRICPHPNFHQTLKIFSFFFRNAGFPTRSCLQGLLYLAPKVAGLVQRSPPWAWSLITTTSRTCS
jgi:hypothetical protein